MTQQEYENKIKELQDELEKLKAASNKQCLRGKNEIL